MRVRIAIAAAVAVLLGAALSAHAQDAKSIFEKRDDTMKLLGKSFYPINRALKGTVQLDLAAAATTTDTAAQSLSPALFAPGSDLPDSNMKPEAGQQPEKVAKYLADLKVNTAKLVETAKGGDKEAIAVAFQSANQVCNACHQDFRKPRQ